MSRSRWISRVAVLWCFLLVGCSKELVIPSVEEVSASLVSVVFEPSNQMSLRFMEAVKNGEQDLVEDLTEFSYRRNMEGGVFVYLDIKDENGWTPLLWAVLFNDIEMTEILLRAGASADIRAHDGTTALGLAVSHNASSIAELLIKEVREIDCADSDGRTPLMLAVSRGNLELIDELLSKGASIEIRDAEGLSAIDYARLAHNAAAYRRLLEELPYWRYLAETSDAQWEYRPYDGLQGDPSTAQLWIKQTPIPEPRAGSSPPDRDDGQQADSDQAAQSPSVYWLVEIACAKRELRVVEKFAERRQVAAGAEEWGKAIPETLGENWFQVACPFFVELSQVVTPNPAVPDGLTPARRASAIR